MSKIDYRDANYTPEERADALLSEMTIEEKMGQTVGIFWMPGKMVPDLLKGMYPTGIGQVSTLFYRGLDSVDECAQAQIDMQKKVMELSPHHIPAVFHQEGLCGAQERGDVSFPSGIGRGSSFDPELGKKIGQIVSRQEASLGITQVLAPVLDVARDPRFGRTNEPYGEDPTVNGALGSAYTHGIQETTTDGRTPDACAKHFVAFHNAQGGVHGTNVSIDERELREISAKSFQMAISDAKLKGVMPCYCTINGQPVHGSKSILTDLLREEMGFDGQAISDYCGPGNMFNFQHVTESKAEAGYRAMRAGLDVELPMKDCFNDELMEGFKSGKYDLSILDKAVKRILTAKFRMGIFEHPFSLEGQELHRYFDETKEDEEVTLASAREAIVLLKNDNNVLPIKEAKNILVIGAQAVTARTFFGGYTHLSMEEGLLASQQTMAGVGQEGNDGQVNNLPGCLVENSEGSEYEAIMEKQKPGIHTILDELKERIPAELSGATVEYSYGYPVFGNDDSHFDEAIEKAKEADMVILCLGGKNGTSRIASMGEGVDGTDIGLPVCQEMFLERLEKEHLKASLIGVHYDGRPISSDRADRILDAILECWNPSEKGAQALVDVLTGKVNPSGKMPVTVARSAGQIPVYYNHNAGAQWHQGDSIGFNDYVDMPHTPRYYFGYGLSYTSFKYSNFNITKTDLKPQEEVTLSFDLKNTGAMDGTEIVQLYLSDPHASMVRPVQTLIGFARVDLKAGQTKNVKMTFDPSVSAFLDEDMKWLIEKGVLELKVGSSSQDIRLETEINVTENAYIVGRERCFKAIIDIE